ncbi:MAG: cyclopropane-fatty-acyl-phospholipid synthase, partial [Desulfovibrionaceae bacterium]
MQAKDVLQSLAEKADIRINGNRPWDVQVHNENLYRRVLGQGTLGLGEAYMDGWWDCERMDVMIEKALNARVDGRISGNLPTLLHVAAQKLFNLQSVARAGIVAERHYNAERAMFETMLDPYMQYSCAYWRALPDQAAAPAD